MATTSSKRVRVAVACAVLVVGAMAAGRATAHGQGIAGPADGETIAAWTERWMEGPASLIATRDETRFYAELETAQERLQFIRLFWQRRDPLARSPRNEYLDEFERRLAHAQEHYAARGQEGWETIFGQVVLLFGPPDRTRRELGLGRDVSDRPPILWSYDERLPGMEPNEDLLFVFRAGRWKLMPPFPIGGGVIPEAARQAERDSLLGGIPSDYQLAIDQSIERSLVNAVNYQSVVNEVATSVRLPDAEIPFGWSARSVATNGDVVTVEIDLTWRMSSLIFHLVDGEFVTDMVIDVQLLRDDAAPASATERVLVSVPEADMASRQDEVVRRTLTLEAGPGQYRLELNLLDQLLGYRTFYSDEIEVESR